MTNTDVVRSMICLLAIDGNISTQEMQFLQDMRKTLHVSQQAVEETLDLIRQGKGRIHLSKDPAELKQMFAMLVQAAAADGKVGPQERKILDTVASKIGLSEDQVSQYIQQKMKDALFGESAPLSKKIEAPSSISCPKCGFEQEAGRASCLRCGVLFKRLEEQDAETIACPKCGTVQKRSASCRKCGAELHQSSLGRAKIFGQTKTVPLSPPKSRETWIAGDVLYTKTSLLRRLLYLGNYCRTVEVDRREQEIRVKNRWLWVFKTSKVIPFSRFRPSYIETTYHSRKWQRSDSFSEADYHESHIRYGMTLCLQNPYGRYELITFGREESFQEYYDLFKAFTS